MIARIREHITLARTFSRVSTWLPAFFNPLFRKQGPVNSHLLDALTELTVLNQQLEERNRELGKRQEQVTREAGAIVANAENEVRALRSLLRSQLATLAALDRRFAQQDLELAETNQRITDIEQRLVDRLGNLGTELGSKFEKSLEERASLLRADFAKAIGPEMARIEIKLSEMKGAVDHGIEQLASVRADVRQLDASVVQCQAGEKKLLDEAGGLASELQQRTRLFLTSLSAQNQNLNAVGTRLERLELLATTMEDAYRSALVGTASRSQIKSDGNETGVPESSTDGVVKTAGSEEEQRELAERFSQLYLEFENRFRGSRAEIIAKQGVYIPHVREAAERIGVSADRLLACDLGCGRGEWLELLTNNGFILAKGVDTNPSMIAACRERGLSALEANAMVYLRDQGDNTLHFITAFHLIEHLSLSDRFQLYQQVHRVLAVGGVAIFETPNPENLIVGSCNFYMDPTHIRPLVPTTEEFILKHLGFSQVQVLRLHPFDSSVWPADTGPLADQFNQFLYGPRDFALMCVK